MHLTLSLRVAEEFDPLAPSGAEITVTAVVLILIVLLAGALVRWLHRRNKGAS